MIYFAELFGVEDSSVYYLLLATIILLVIPALCANFISLIVACIITAPLLIDFMVMLINLPVVGDLHGYVGVMNVLLLLPAPNTLLTRIGGLLMQGRGWSRQKAIRFDVAGIIMFFVSAYLYSVFGNTNPALLPD